MLIECNGRNVLSQVMDNRFNLSLSLSLSLSLQFLLLLYLLYIFYFLLSFSLSPPPLGDGDYICAGSHRQHELYIWDKATGSLVKGESLLDLTWHPVKPVILSVPNGLVNIWSHAQTELWSAYAPNFKELDENEDYEERERASLILKTKTIMEIWRMRVLITFLMLYLPNTKHIACKDHNN